MKAVALGGDSVSSGDMSRDLTLAAVQIEGVIRRCSFQQRDDLLSAASACEEAFSRGASMIREEARNRVRLGAPPSLRRLVGVSNLEVPMNRVLGWMLDPSRRGTAARHGLRSLAALLDFRELAGDIDRGLPITVLTESSPDLEITSRQPDLLVGSEHAALLIENKVGSPESGPDQYSHYLETLRTWAGSRPSRAYLLAPTERPTPPGWDRSLSHMQLAEALRPLIAEPAISFWDRVAYALLVNDLDPDTNADRVHEIERLIGCEHSLSDVAVATRLTHLLRHPTIDPTNGGF